METQKKLAPFCFPRATGDAFQTLPRETPPSPPSALHASLVAVCTIFLLFWGMLAWLNETKTSCNQGVVRLGVEGCLAKTEKREYKSTTPQHSALERQKRVDAAHADSRQDGGHYLLGPEHPS